MGRCQHRNTGDMKKQGSMVSSKEHSNPPEVDPELKEIYEMTDLEFKLMSVRKPNEMKENTNI